MGGEKRTHTPPGVLACGPHELPAPQPGGRAPAPGELATAQAFINSHFDLVDDWGADLLATPAGLSRWYACRSLLSADAGPLGERDLNRALAVREGLRVLAADNRRVANDATASPPDARRLELNDAIGELALRVVFEPRCARIVPVAQQPPATRALAAIVAIALRAMLDGTWARLKVCPGPHCGWAFYDASRNNSGRWCSMSVCGGRAKARTQYRRRRAAAP